MAGTIAADERHNTNYSIANAQHHNMVIETGVYTPSTGSTAYTSAGDSVTFASGITPFAVMFADPMTSVPSTGGLHYIYDPDNASVHWRLVGIEATTTADVTGLTAQYVAIGWK